MYRLYVTVFSQVQLKREDVKQTVMSYINGVKIKTKKPLGHIADLKKQFIKKTQLHKDMIIPYNIN